MDDIWYGQTLKSDTMVIQETSMEKIPALWGMP